MKSVSRQKVVVLVDEIQRHLQARERVGADVLAAERLDEREVERNSRVVRVQRRVRRVQVVGGARELPSQRDECEEREEKQCAVHLFSLAGWLASSVCGKSALHVAPAPAWLASRSPSLRMRTGNHMRMRNYHSLLLPRDTIWRALVSEEMRRRFENRAYPRAIEESSQCATHSQAIQTFKNLNVPERERERAKSQQSSHAEMSSADILDSEEVADCGAFSPSPRKIRRGDNPLSPPKTWPFACVNGVAVSHSIRIGPGSSAAKTASPMRPVQATCVVARRPQNGHARVSSPDGGRLTNSAPFRGEAIDQPCCRKPDCSYAVLIGIAMRAAQSAGHGPRLPVIEIYRFIE